MGRSRRRGLQRHRLELPGPLPDNPRIRDLIFFLNEKAEIYLDDERLDRPNTHWSKGFRSNTQGGGSGSEQGPYDAG